MIVFVLNSKINFLAGVHDRQMRPARNSSWKRWNNGPLTITLLIRLFSSFSHFLKFNSEKWLFSSVIAKIFLQPKRDSLWASSVTNHHVLLCSVDLTWYVGHIKLFTKHQSSGAAAVFTVYLLEYRVHGADSTRITGMRFTLFIHACKVRVLRWLNARVRA